MLGKIKQNIDHDNLKDIEMKFKISKHIVSSHRHALFISFCFLGQRLCIDVHHLRYRRLWCCLMSQHYQLC